MMFKDRIEAGQKLAQKVKETLEPTELKDGIVLGLPRGGVVVAKVFADELQLPLEVLVCRKLRSHFNPEFAVGAVCEGGKPLIEEALEDPLYLQAELEFQKKEIERRKKLFRKNAPLKVKNKIVFLVDDGIATGKTVLAGIQALKDLGASQIIVAAPVVAADTLREIERAADQAIVLEAPQNFYAVGQFYEDFREITDEQVIEIIQETKTKKRSQNPVRRSAH